MRAAPHAIRRRGLSLVEALALCVGIMVITVLATVSLLENHLTELLRNEDPFAEVLAQTYGPNRHSQYNEEWIIRDHFQDRRDGIFLDVGANHYRRHSNTFFLERELGWSGIAVEPLQEFASDYATHRPRTRFAAVYASDTEDSTVDFFVGGERLVSSSNADFTKRYGQGAVATSVPTTTLNAILNQSEVQRIDLLTMDIELAEPKALAGFDIQKFRPSLVCIEAHPEVRQQILDYFARSGYTVIGKYLRIDRHNLYFKPLN